MNNLSEKEQNLKLFTIGEISKLTGINSLTLRTWEARYGFPKPKKLESGHRRYTLEHLDKLRLVKIAVDQGEKASVFLPLSLEAIKRWLNEKEDGKSLEHSLSIKLDEVFSYIDHWNERGLVNFLEKEWTSKGPLSFVCETLTFLLQRIGQSWAFGKISIADEHFATEIIIAFLRGKWSQNNDLFSDKRIILVTPENEMHAIGLHMCAVVLTLENHNVLFLGTNVPMEDLLAAAISSQASGIVVSISNYIEPKKSKNYLEGLREKLSNDVKIIAGGSGSPENLDGIVTIKSMATLYRWIQNKGF